MDVRFYLDPLCPWCWVTSHWLDEVAPHRDLRIDWRSISLLVRNEGQEVDPEYLEKYGPAMERSFKLLRIVEAMRAGGNADKVRDVYIEWGRHIHHGEDGMTFDVGQSLEKAGADPAYAAAFDDVSLDAAVRASTAEAEAVAGDDVGTPIVAFEVGGRWKGYFGPVIPSVVRGDAALKLWDGLAALIETEGFFELKRTRDVDLDLASVHV